MLQNEVNGKTGSAILKYSTLLMVELWRKVICSEAELSEKVQVYLVFADFYRLKITHFYQFNFLFGQGSDF